MRAFYFDPGETIINIVDGESTTVIEQSSPLWSYLRDTMAIDPYSPPPPPPEPTIEEIRAEMPPLSRRQVFIALMQSGAITEEEAIEAAGGGAIPAVIDVIINGLPAAQRGAARITFRAFQYAMRLDPLATMIGAAANMSDTDIDQFWTAASAI